MIFLPHTNTVILLEPYCGTITEPGLPVLRGAGTGFVVVLPLPLNFDPPLYILHFTIYTTFHRKETLKAALELLDYRVNNNTRVYQIHKEGGVANRFLTARRHF